MSVFSLTNTEFNTSHFENGWAPRDDVTPEICQYRGYRYNRLLSIPFHSILFYIALCHLSNIDFVDITTNFRNPPNSSLPREENYNYSSHYWHVFAARLAFVVVFEVCSE